MSGGNTGQFSNFTNDIRVFLDGEALAEANLLHFPICLLSKNNVQELLEESARKRQSHIVFKYRREDGALGEWRVIPTTEYGYPTSFDKSVIMAVLKLITEDGFPPPRFYRLGTATRVCAKLRLSLKSKRNLTRVRKSIERIAATSFYTDIFYQKGTNSYWKGEGQERGGIFTLWNVFWASDILPEGRVADCIILELNSPLLLGLAAHYVRPIDYEYWNTLPPGAQRLYELTGLKFKGLKDSQYIKYDFLELCSRMPVLAQQHFSKAKTVFDRFHNQLLKDKWFSQVEWLGGDEYPRLNKEHPWVIRYYPGQRAFKEIEQAEERLGRYHQLVHKSAQLLDWQDVQGWANILSEELRDLRGKNRGFYVQIAKLILLSKISDTLIWRSISEAKRKDLQGEMETSRSQCFTDELKRLLKTERNLELKQLLSQI
jgi:hypothetical protein